MYKILSILLLLMVGLHGFGQTIDPTKQINWYLGSIPNLSSQFVNNTVMADQYGGSDACQKLHNAMMYALSNHVPTVDATGFVGTQACASNPFLNLTIGSGNIGTSVQLEIKFGTTHFQTVTPWIIVNSGISLHGAGSYLTLVEYTGASCSGTPATCAALDLNTDSGTGVPAEQGGPLGVNVEGMYFYGDSSNIVDGIILNSSRSKFTDVHAWGATGCGIHAEGAVANTYIHPVVSSTDALLAGVAGSGHTVPANGICFDQDTTFGTVACTASTIVDPIMEGVTGSGIDIIKGNNLVFTGGTSEINSQHGILIGAGSGVINKQNTFIGIDLEGNGADTSANGTDVEDGGQNNTYINILATSHCSSSCHSVDLVGGGSQYVLGGQLGDEVNNSGIGGGGASGIPIVGYSTSSATSGSASALPGAPAGYMVQEINGTIVKVPYWNF